ncbi:MAG: ATP-binding protein [Hyphomicrobiaceae bacterium]|nr:ATP-binding protein [Hyphomicrobiaceae bacterium]
MDWRATSQDWLKRIAGPLEAVSPRIAARRELLTAATVLTCLFVLLGGLSLAAGLIGLALVCAWATLTPSDIAAVSQDLATTLTRHNEVLWKHLIEGIPEPALVLGPTGHILYINAPGQELLGSGRVGLHFTSLSRDPELVAAVDRALESGQMATVELQERVPVERRRSATVAALGSKDESLASPAILITVRDLTEQDRLARMRADFVANASHELRTPLASLKGFVETLQGAAKDDPGARERFLRVMSEQADRMTRLIDDLLSLSRVEMREHLPPSERVDIEDTLNHVVQALQPLAERSGTALRLNPAGSPAFVRGDRDELVQVFQNLIQNALKYGRAGGSVEITIGRQPGRLAVAVKDNGPGIAPQHLPRLTERFYRINVAASRERGGTGLGLAIVKHILNRHRGELEVQSEVGQGSTFTVHLPALP